MNRVGKSLFIITDTKEEMETVINKINELFKIIDGVEYGWDNDQPIN